MVFLWPPYDGSIKEMIKLNGIECNISNQILYVSDEIDNGDWNLRIPFSYIHICIFIFLCIMSDYVITFMSEIVITLFMNNIYFRHLMK